MTERRKTEAAASMSTAIVSVDVEIEIPNTAPYASDCGVRYDVDFGDWALCYRQQCTIKAGAACDGKLIGIALTY